MAGNQEWPIASKMLHKNQFDRLLTMDKKLYKQQNLLKFDLVIVVLQAVDNKIPTLLKVVSSLNKLLANSLQADIYLIKA